MDHFLTNIRKRLFRIGLAGLPLAVLLSGLFSTISTANGQIVVEGMDDLRLEMIPEFQGGFSSIQVSNVNGVKTTKVSENGRQYTIGESADEVSVTFSKSYGPNDYEQLRVDHPDLYMHVTAFPTQSGDAKISLTVNAEVTRTAKTAADLEQQFPEAFEIFEKYSKRADEPVRIFRRGFMPFDFRFPDEDLPSRERYRTPRPRIKIDT